MKTYPQDEALKYARLFPECTRLNVVANNMCCASVALWIIGIDEKNHIEIILQEFNKSLESDCTVLWQPFFKAITGREIKVEFRDIKSLDELKYIKGRIAVKFSYNGHCHWVGVERGRVAYNPLFTSQCVEKGNPVTARIITEV